MREQKGQVFRKGKSWFVRYCDDVMRPDGTIKRKRVCKKLSVDFCDEYRTRKSVQSFVDEILAPVNGGLLNPQSTMSVGEFVEKVYLPEYVEKQLASSTQKTYRDSYENHLKHRLGNLTLRGFRTVHGEQFISADCGQDEPGPQLADALEKHTLRTGEKLAQPNKPIFQAGNGKPLNLDNLVRRVIVPALTRCEVCKSAEFGHKDNGHIFKIDASIPRWHGWHAFRRGLATNLHQLGVADKDIQSILRHSNVGLTVNVYIKSVTVSQINAMDALSARLEKEACKDLATNATRNIN